MKLTSNYQYWDSLIANPLSDPLCQLLANEGEYNEIDQLINLELAEQHLTKSTTSKDLS